MTEQSTLVKDRKISFSESSDQKLDSERFNISLTSSANVEDFPGLRTLSDAILKNESIWICGKKRKNVFGKDKTIYLYVTTEGYKVQHKLKQGKEVPAASIMVPNEEVILCAEEGGNCIFSLDPSNGHFRSVYTNSDLAIAAICSNSENTFLIDQKKAQYLRILDFSFYPTQNVFLNIGKTEECYFDIALLQVESKNYVVVCKSETQPCVVAVDPQDGTILWEINSSTNKTVRTDFNPCSVTISDAGNIFLADAHRIILVSADGSIVPSELEGIDNPVKIRVDEDGQRLMVINKGGYEIRNYSITGGRKEAIAIAQKLPTNEKNTFSGMEAIDCCSRNMCIHYFGSLRSRKGAPAIVTMKIYLSGVAADDISKVQKRERRYTNPVELLQRHELLISQQPYDATERTLKIALQPVDDKTWESFMKTPTSMEFSLHKVLRYRRGHICKQIPREVVEFNFEASKENVNNFRVRVEELIENNNSGEKHPNVFIMDIRKHVY